MGQRPSGCFRAGLATAIALAVGASASADGNATPAAPPEQRSRDILARIDSVPEEPGWISRHISLDNKSGLGISRSLTYGNHRFELRLRGPVYKTPLRRKNFGLKLELKF